MVSGVDQALAPLAEQGSLIVASGNITHNLGDWPRASGAIAIDTSYAQRFMGTARQFRAVMASMASKVSCACLPQR